MRGRESSGFAAHPYAGAHGPCHRSPAASIVRPAPDLNTHLDDFAPTAAAVPVHQRRVWAAPGRDLLRLLLVAGAIMAGGWLGLLTPALPPFISLFWPPAGIALAALACWGPRTAWGVVLGAGLLNLLLGATPLQALLVAGGNLAGPALALAAMRQLGFRAQLGRRRELGLFLLLGVLLGPLISASYGVLVLYLLGQLPPTALAEALWCWWGGDAVGVMTVAPALLSLPSWRPGQAWQQRGLTGTALLMLATLFSAALLFFGQTGHGAALSPWLFVPHLLLCGLALRSSLAAATVTALGLALMAALATSTHSGPFYNRLAAAPLTEALALLWGYAASAAAMPLLIQTLISELRDDRRRWRTALEAVGMGVAEWQAGGRTGYASPGWRRLIGPMDTQATQPTDWLEAAHSLDRERVAGAVARLLPANGPDDCCEPLRLGGANGEWRWYELRAHVQERGPQGQTLRLLSTLSDITWRHTAEERQRMSASLFQHLHEGLLVTDTEHRVLDANPSYCRLLGLSREAVLGQTAAPLLPLALRRSGQAPETLQQTLQDEGFWQGRVQLARADDTPLVLQLTVSAIPEPDGPLRYRVVTVSDLTQALQQRDLLERQSRFDGLTALPNHEEFTRLLHRGLATAEREGFRLSVCRIDLDQFKRINSQHGPAAADELLQQVAQRLRGALRSSPQWSDVVGRLGGDEFALLLRAHGPEEAQLALERLLNVLRAPYRLCPPAVAGELLLEITASIGATLFPQDDSDAETLLRHAGHALYRVKHAGRNGLRFFDTAKRLRNEASLIELARVQQALDAGELQLHYQPKIDMQSGQVLGMEALLRWQHPERGLLAPVHFLPLIEPTGLGVQVGDWVIEQALRQSAQWLAAGLSLNLSVNVTARQLQMPDFAQRLQELINRHAEPVARHLSLEVLESAALADIAATHALIQRCRGLGVSFALDDFGTGYSTLTYLKRLPVDALKIDRSFVQNMLIDAQDMALVEGVIGLARHFGCSVVAEGVESAAHARALLRMGCQQGQGNGIAPAMPAAEVPGWIESFARSPWRMQLGGREQGLA